jgi:hypothetical protein
MSIAQQLKQDRAGLIQHMKSLTESGQHDKVLKIAESLLFEDPDDISGLFFAASAHSNTGHEETAYQLMTKAVSMRPDKPEIWQNMGHISDKLWRYEDALYAYGKALELDPNDYQTLASLSSALVGLGDPEQAIVYAERALEINKVSEIAQVNKGFGHLTLKEWSEGWKGYQAMLGHTSKRRKAIAYTVPPKIWDGKTHEDVVIYGEQGIGDEIMFSSCIADASKHARNIVIDCDKKLEGLFRRSFPDCHVYGTRHEDAPVWMSHEPIDSSIAIGSLPFHYRNNDEDFPGTPYLVADPLRRKMYRALLDGLGDGLKVGISWHGGNSLGGVRKLELDRLQDLVDSFPGVHWVSLNYKDHPNYGLPIHDFKFCTQTTDYDDTAALVAELDLVISVPQAVVHLAGALGKECWCMTPDVARWIYGTEGDKHTWYGSVRMFRDWETMTDQIKEALNEYDQ